MAYNVAAELFAEWAIGMVVIAVRLYARWSIGKASFYWDDGCLLLAMVSWTFLTHVRSRLMIHQICWTIFTVTLYYCIGTHLTSYLHLECLLTVNQMCMGLISA